MKGKKVLIIAMIIVLILILGIGGVVLAYMKTDFLKTDEQLFYKYMAEIGADLTDFRSEELENYLEKTQNIPYENDSKLTVNVDMPKNMLEGFEDDYWNIVNGLNITFKGKIDNKSKRAEQDISINYSDSVAFPIGYKRNGDLYAATSSLILKTYLAVKNENLDILYDNLNDGIIKKNVPSKIDMDRLNISTKVLSEEISKITEILKNNIDDTNFSKVDDSSFALNLNEQETITILTKILEELKNSNLLQEDAKAQLEVMLEGAKTVNASTDEFLKIIVRRNGSLSFNIQGEEIINAQIKSEEINIVIKIDRSSTITINLKKTGTVDDFGYTINCMVMNDGYIMHINFASQYAGITTQSSRERYKIGFKVEENEQAIGYQYTFDTKKNFSEIINIEPLKETDAFVINTADKEYLKTLFEAIGKVFNAVNTNQMNELGLKPEQNPLIYATPVGYAIYSLNQVIIDSVSGMTDNMKIMEFNEKFEIYQGSQVGMNIQILIEDVIRNNHTQIKNSINLVSVNGMSGKEELQEYANKIKITKQYNVTMEKDAKGYINTIKISE